MNKTLKKILIWIAILASVFVATGWFFIYKYNNVVSNIIIQNLNKRLASEVLIKNADLTFFSSFPLAGLVFNEITIMEKTKSQVPDTLITLNQLNLNFNIIDLINQKFEIKHIEAKTGKANIKIFEDGSDNYHFFNPSTDSSTDFSINLQKVKLSNIKLSYYDIKQNDQIFTQIHSAYLSGNFSETEFDMELAGDFFMQHLQVAGVAYLKEKDLKLESQLAVNLNQNHYTFTKGDLTIANHLNFNFSGNVKESVYQLNFSGKKIQLLDVRRLLPVDFSKYFEDFDATGLVDFKADISGNSAQKNAPKIEAHFAMKNGSATLEKGLKPIKNLNFSGSYKTTETGKPEQATLIIDSIKGTVDEGNLMAKATIKNLLKPQIKGEFLADLHFKESPTFFNLDSVQLITGAIKLAVTGNLILSDWKFPTEHEINQSSFQGQITLNQVDFGFDAKNPLVEQVNGQFNFYKNHLLFTEFSCLYNQSNLSGEGLLKNFVQWAFNTSNQLEIKSNLTIDKLKLEDWIGSESSEAAFKIPKHYVFEISTTLNQFSYQNFATDSISGHVLLAEGNLQVSRLKCKTMRGVFLGNLRLTQLSSGYEMESKFQFVNTDVKQFFESFNNFGQNTVQSKHLSGNANAVGQFSAKLTDQLSFDLASIKSQFDLNINNGELIGFEPFSEITKYFESNAILKKVFNTKELDKRLKHIKFSTLENTIKVENSLISIPKTEIKSTALNIELSGTHTFTNEINYELVFNLADLMMKDKTSETEFGQIEDDGLGGKIVFLTIKGTTDVFEIETNKLNQRQYNREIIKREKEAVTKIIKAEILNPKSKENTNKPIDFEISWDEFEEEKTNTNNLDSTKIPADTTKEKSIKKLLKKLTEEEKSKQKTFEFEFDDDF